MSTRYPRSSGEETPRRDDAVYERAIRARLEVTQ